MGSHLYATTLFVCYCFWKYTALAFLFLIAETTTWLRSHTINMPCQTHVLYLNNLYILIIIEEIMYIYVSRVLDRQLLNGWCHHHQNSRLCSRPHSHESVICSCGSAHYTNIWDAGFRRHVGSAHSASPAWTLDQPGTDSRLRMLRAHNNSIN